MLRTRAAAAYCGSSKSTFKKYRLFGGGPIFIRIGRHVVYSPQDLDVWLGAKRRTHTGLVATS
jgi:hypothetical protein